MSRATGSVTDRFCFNRRNIALRTTDRSLELTASARILIEKPFQIATASNVIVCHCIATATRLTPAHRLTFFNQKVAVKKAAARWLPDYIIRRPKASFGLPVRSWTRKTLVEMINDLLPRGKLVGHGIIDDAVLRDIISRNESGQEDLAHVVWNLHTLELWIRKNDIPLAA
jgi:asparagine synthetase B (glutamine-hydrolysing)